MRRRRHRVRGDSATGGEFSSTMVFITPMLDMAFQILAFFVFTYSPSAVEGQFPIDLSAGEQAGEEMAVKPDEKVAAEPTELRPSIFIEARAKEQGRLGMIRIRSLEGKVDLTMPQNVQDEGERRDALLKALSNKLIELKALNPTEDRITIEGTPTLHWDEMMKVIDACRRGIDPASKAKRELFPRVNLGFIEQ